MNTDVDTLAERIMDAMVASDGGNNPFYRDDEETVSLCRQIAEHLISVETQSGIPLSWPNDASD